MLNYVKKGGNSPLPNAPSTTGNKSGKGRGNNPPSPPSPKSPPGSKLLNINRLFNIASYVQTFSFVDVD